MGIDACPQHSVLFARVRDADAVVDIAEAPDEHLVEVDGGGIGKAEQGVVGEAGWDAHGFGMHEALVANN